MMKKAARMMGRIDWREYTTLRLAQLSRPERLAIIRYLEHRMTGDPDDLDGPTIQQALERYWRPSLLQPEGPAGRSR